jgi:ferritin-like protein
MSIDDAALGTLLEESSDLHSDAMARTCADLDELVERHAGEADQDPDATSPSDGPRFHFPKGGLLAAAGAGAAFAVIAASPAFAASKKDVQMLQTAASIENLAVATYDTALTLPFIGGSEANGVVKTFVEKTREQHVEHAAAFNAAVKQLKGKPQTKPNPVLLRVVENAKAGLTDPGAVVALALELEDGATATYVVNTGKHKDANARSVTASIMGVEAQHSAILRAVAALLAANAPQLIALPPDAAALPAAAGSVGFPDGFFPTTAASPAKQGAVK